MYKFAGFQVAIMVWFAGISSPGLPLFNNKGREIAIYQRVNNFRRCRSASVPAVGLG